MKNLIIIGGTMGVGKSATCRELQKLLPKNVFWDGDWCWDMQPFIVTHETKAMVMIGGVNIDVSAITASEAATQIAKKVGG